MCLKLMMEQKGLGGIRKKFVKVRSKNKASINLKHKINSAQSQTPNKSFVN